MSTWESVSYYNFQSTTQLTNMAAENYNTEASQTYVHIHQITDYTLLDSIT